MKNHGILYSAARTRVPYERTLASGFLFLQSLNVLHESKAFSDRKKSDSALYLG